jgi:hypothetical protein
MPSARQDVNGYHGILTLRAVQMAVAQLNGRLDRVHYGAVDGALGVFHPFRSRSIGDLDHAC